MSFQHGDFDFLEEHPWGKSKFIRFYILFSLFFFFSLFMFLGLIANGPFSYEG